MQPTNLSPEAFAYISRELKIKARDNGPVILGSQLGKLINEAIMPRHLRDFGGLRRFAEFYLAGVIRQCEFDLQAHDVKYEILGALTPADRAPVAPIAFRRVTGAELWRFFSNPNIKCQLAVLDTAVVVVSADGVSLPSAAESMPRFGSSDYRKLAETFAKEHSGNMQIGVALLDALRKDDFYSDWIVTLRALRVEQSDLLRKWEILREEAVSQALTDALSKAGVEATRVAEIVQLARNSNSSRAGRSTHIPAVGRDATQAPTGCPTRHFTLPAQFYGGGSLSSVDETEELRKLVHRAVEVMSLTELREIRLSANTLMKLTAQKHV